MRRFLLCLAALTAFGVPASARADVVDDNPAVTSAAAGRLDVVARAADGSILYRRLTTSTGAWTAWSRIPGLTASSGPAITADGGKLIVAARGTNDALYYTTGDGTTWSAWTSLGGGLSSGPGLDNRNGTTEVDVGAIGLNGAFYYRVRPSATTAFKPFASVATGGTTAPGMVSRTKSTIDAFTRGGDGSVIRIYYIPGAGWKTATIGGTTQSAISAITRSDTRMDIYLRGTNGALYGRIFDGTNWASSYTRFDSSAGTSAPAAATTGGGRVDMVVRDATKLYHRFYDGKGADHGWHPWTDAGAIALPPAPAPTPTPEPTPDRGAPNGTNAADGATVTLAFTGSAKTRRTFRYHRKVELHGTLTGPAGPIGGAIVDLAVTPTNPGASQRVIQSVSTAADGAFAATIKAGPSRRIVARYRAFANDTTTADSPALVARSRTAVTFKASRKRAHRGDRVRFRGRLLGRPIPARGKLLILQAFDAGRWRTFDQVRTTRTGVYRASYRFRTSPPRARTLRFRVRVPEETAYPYEHAFSRTRRLTLLPG